MIFAALKLKGLMSGDFKSYQVQEKDKYHNHN